jgi:hypothetical protein
MERLLFRSTSITHLQAELRRHDLLRDAERYAPDRGERRRADASRRRGARPFDLRTLVRRLAGS